MEVDDQTARIQTLMSDEELESDENDASGTGVQRARQARA